MIASIHSWSSSPLVLGERNSQPLTMGSDEVHVWQASLSLTVSSLQSLQQTLTIDERTRAEQFRFQQDREHFIAARGLLRTILSRYLGVEPNHLRFCYNSNGKPALIPSYGGDTLRFNLSHSYGLALYAVTRDQGIGIDLEYVRTNIPWQEMAEQFFSSRENGMLRSLPVDLQPKAFFNCWTRKEAYIKATGKGLSIPLNQFDVSLVPGEPAALLSTQWDPQEAARWSLQELILGPKYVAALAVEGDRCQLKCCQLLVRLGCD